MIGRSRANRWSWSAVVTMTVLFASGMVVGEPEEVVPAGSLNIDSKKPTADTLQKGKHGVSGKTGALTYSYPIAVPPGRHDLQPSLSLDYSSRAPLRGGIAAGWTLNGPGTIRHDKSGYYVSMGGDSGRLVRVNPDVAAYGGKTYRLELDHSFTRFEYLDNGANAWYVRTSDGRRHHFVWAGVEGLWLLADSKDAHGNRIDYIWEALGGPNPQQVAGNSIGTILYTSNTSAGLTAHAKVVFEWNSETWNGLDFCGTGTVPVGANMTFRGGLPYHEGARKLLSVTTYVKAGGNWRKVRKVSLDYEPIACYEAVNQHRILSGIVDQGFDAEGQLDVTAPEVTFSYGPVTRDLNGSLWVDLGLGYPDQTYFPNNQKDPDDKADTNPSTMLQDFNGDGLLDVLTSAAGDEGCVLSVRYGQFGGGLSSVSYPFALPSVPMEDGRLPGDEDCSLYGQRIDRSNLEGTAAGDLENGPYNYCMYDNAPGYQDSRNVYRFVDLDGDGRLDLLTQLLADPAKWDPWTDDAIRDGIGNPSCIYMAMPPPSFDGPFQAECTPQSCPGFDPPPNPPARQLCLFPQRCGDGEPLFVLRAYRNNGTEFVPMEHSPSLGILPIEAGNPRPRSIGVFDIDGDQLPDLVYQASEPDVFEYGQVDAWTVFKGDGQGGFSYVPKFWSIPTVGNLAIYPTGFEGDIAYNEPQSPETKWRNQSVSLADFNGDGFVDLLVNKPVDAANTTAYVYWNQVNDMQDPGFAATGHEIQLYGNYNDARSWHSTSTVKITDFCDVFPYSGCEYERSYRFRMLDYDADGLDDLLMFANGGAHVFLNSGGEFATGSFPVDSKWSDAARTVDLWPYGWRVDSDALDITGDGLVDAVHDFGNGWHRIYTDTVDGQPPRLLTSIDNGQGGVMSFRYASSADPAVVAVSQGEERHLPHHLWVIEEVTSDSSYGTSPPITTRYSYKDPVYQHNVGDPAYPDRTPKQFQGFRETTTYLPTPAGQPGGAVVVDTYTYDCADGCNGTGCHTGSYTFDHAGQLLAYTETDWTSRHMFVPGEGGPCNCFGYPVFTYASATRSKKCHPIGNACWSQDWDSHSTTTYEPGYVDGRAAYFLRRWTQQGTGLDADSSTLERRTETWHIVDGYPSGEHYRILPTHTFKSHREGGEWVEHGRTEITYDVNRCPVSRKRWIDGGEFAETRTTCDPQTGNVLSTTKPQQVVGSGASKTYTYEPNQVHVETITNELGQIERFSTDLGTGKRTMRRGPNGHCDNTGCDWEEEEWVYDGFGRLLETYRTDSGWSLQLVSKTAYHDAGVNGRRVITGGWVEPDTWLSTETQIDGLGRVITVTRKGFEGGPDATTWYYYDAAGNIDQVYVPKPGATSISHVPYTYRYDQQGRVLGVTRPDGVFTSVTYAGLSKTVTENTVDGSGSITTVVHDPLGRLVSVTEAGGGTTTYGYDAADNLSRIEDADGNVNYMEHDWLGRRTAVTRGERIWTFVYDLNGNIIERGLPGGIGSEWTNYAWYDDLDRVTMKRPATRGMSSERMEELAVGDIVYSYDNPLSGLAGIGRLSAVELPWGSVSYLYYPGGNLLAEFRSFDIDHLVTASDSQYIAYTYDSMGRMTQSIHDGMYIVENEYDDARGLPEKVRWVYPGGSKIIEDHMRAIDGSILRRNTDPSFSQYRQFTYDVLGRRVTDQIWQADGGPGDTYETECEHLPQPPPPQNCEVVVGTGGKDPCEGAKGCEGTYETGCVITPPHSACERISSCSVGANYECPETYDTGCLSRAPTEGCDELPNAWPSFCWFGRHRYRCIQSPVCQKLECEAPQSDELVAERNYFFNQTGNISAVTGFTRVGGVEVEADAIYGYDQLRRLTSAWGPNGYYGTYSYSHAGNMLSHNVIWPGDDPYQRCMQYAYAGEDPQAVTSLGNSCGSEGSAAFGYDATGNMTVKNFAGENTTMEWDGWNRLVAVHNASGEEVYYYDHNGKRVLKINTSGVTWTFGGTRETRYGANGVKTGGWIYAGEARCEDEGAYTCELQYHDVTSNLMLVLDESGQVQEYHHYGPFGEILWGSDTSGEDDTRLFNGKELDASTGLRYYGARYYDPLTMRWNSGDPLYRLQPERGLTEPQKQNLYAFSRNNPLRYLDPNGLEDGEMYESLMTKAIGTVDTLSGPPVKANEFANASSTTERVVKGVELGAAMSAKTGLLLKAVGNAPLGTAMVAPAAVIGAFQAGYTVGTYLDNATGASDAIASTIPVSDKTGFNYPMNALNNAAINNESLSEGAKGWILMNLMEQGREWPELEDYSEEAQKALKERGEKPPENPFVEAERKKKERKERIREELSKTRRGLRMIEKFNL